MYLFPLIRFSHRSLVAWLPALVGLLGAVLLVTDSIWTFRFLGLLPVTLRLLLGGGVALMGLNAPWLAEGLPRLGPGWDVTRLPAWAVIGVSGSIFWLGAERTHYGDGLLKLHLQATAQLQSSPPYIWKAPLDGLIGYWISRLTHALPLPLEQGIAAQSVIAGVVFVLAVGSIARRLTETPAYRSLIVLGLLTLGSSQLWFGHVENYSLVTAGVMVTVAGALAYLDGDVRLGTVGLLGGLAVSFHPQALFAMMALPLITSRLGRWRQILLLMVTGLAIPALVTMILLMLGVPLPTPGTGYVGDTQIFWTPAQLLDLTRLGESLENLWLLIPALPILTPILLFSGVWRRVSDDRRMAYLSGVGVGLLIYHFGFQNDLPRWQDWDLYAVVGPGVALWALAAWATMPRRWPHTLLTALLLSGLAFALAVSGSWITVNHTFRLLDPDPSMRSVTGEYVLADLIDLLPTAQVIPPTPICADPAQDPTGCRRVAPLVITLPTTGEDRAAIFAHAPAQVGFRLELPAEPTFLWVSPILDPAAWGWGGDGVTFRVEVEDGTGRETLWQEHIDPAAMPERGWAEVAVALSAYRGRAVQLWLVTDVGPAGNGDADRAAWGTPWIMLGTPDIRIRED